MSRLQAKCPQRDGEAGQLAGRDLCNREALLKGGQSGPGIVPGDAAASEPRRLPISRKHVGRYHNPSAMAVWMAGAKTQRGQVIGGSDEFGYESTGQPMTFHDIHLTIVDLPGMDHKRLTYYFSGGNERITDVHGELIPQLAS